MSKEQVQAILGPPTSTNTEDKIIYKRTTWRYTKGDKYINITFKNNELDSKDTNLRTQQPDKSKQTIPFSAQSMLLGSTEARNES
jgi:hypothetical protein